MLEAGTWFAGLRRKQSQSRADVPLLKWSNGNRWKVHAIADWSDRDIFNYLKKHDLPYHPYFDQGYVSVGDWHSSRPLTAEDSHERDGRFGGRTQECGLHLDLSPAALASLDDSRL